MGERLRPVLLQPSCWLANPAWMESCGGRFVAQLAVGWPELGLHSQAGAQLHPCLHDCGGCLPVNHVVLLGEHVQGSDWSAWVCLCSLARDVGSAPPADLGCMKWGTHMAVPVSVESLPQCPVGSYIGPAPL